MREGFPLVIKNKKFYFALLSKVSYEAIDWWDFVNEFWEISQKVRSISKEAKTQIKEHLDFLTKEFGEIKEIKKFTRLSEFVKLRNIVVHEYLVKWERIKKFIFIKEVEKLYPKFIEKVKIEAPIA